MTEQRSERYRGRQAARTTAGRYAKMNRCEWCGKSLGVDYASLPNAGTTGLGLVLCPDGKCYKGVSEEDIERVLRDGRKLIEDITRQKVN